MDISTTKKTNCGIYHNISIEISKKNYVEISYT